MSLFKLIGVPRISGVPGFELFFDNGKDANEALVVACGARDSEESLGICDSFDSKVDFNGRDFLFFMLHDVDKACDGKNEDQIAQMRAQKRGQARASADPALNGPQLVPVGGMTFDLGRGKP